jgi:hypothetical protein
MLYPTRLKYSSRLVAEEFRYAAVRRVWCMQVLSFFGMRASAMRIIGIMYAQNG